MAKEELQELDGIVKCCQAAINNNGVVVGAYASGRIRKNHIRILAGDRGTLELSMHDRFSPTADRLPGRM